MNELTIIISSIIILFICRLIFIAPRRRVFVGLYNGIKIFFNPRVDRYYRDKSKTDPYNKTYYIHITKHNMWFKGILDRVTGSWEFERCDDHDIGIALQESRNEKLIDYIIKQI